MKKKVISIIIVLLYGCGERRFAEYNIQMQNISDDAVYIEGFRGKNMASPYIGSIVNKGDYINYAFVGSSNKNVYSTQNNGVKSIKVYTSNTCDYKLLFEYDNFYLINANIEVFNKNNKSLRLVYKSSSIKNHTNVPLKNLNEKGIHQWHSKSLEERCKI